MPQEQFLTLQLHELLAFLNNQGVVTIMTLAQQGMIGAMTSPIDLSYLADTVVLTRYFETEGAIKKAISIIKKRTGNHENSIREFAVSSKGILTGVPRFHGEGSKILKN
jgi:circadian clock protein KaiC